MWAGMLIVLLGPGVAIDSGDRVATEVCVTFCPNPGEVWEGTWEGLPNELYGHCKCKAVLTCDRLSLSREKPFWADSYKVRWIDEGEGNCRLASYKVDATWFRGIYKLESGRLIICLCTSQKRGRPRSFQAGEEQALLILDRVRPSNRIQRK